MLGHNRQASETPFKRRLACGPIMAHRLQWYLDPLSSHQHKKGKNIVKILPPPPPFDKLSGSALDVVACEKWRRPACASAQSDQHL